MPLWFWCYQRWSWGSSSDRKQSGAGTAWCSSCSRSSPPPRQTLRRHRLPPLRSPLQPRCLLHLRSRSRFSSACLHSKQTKGSVFFLLYWFNTKQQNAWRIPTYLSIQEARGQFAFHTAAVSRIHPQQELPAPGEWDGHWVEDLFGVDAVEEKLGSNNLAAKWDHWDFKAQISTSHLANLQSNTFTANLCRFIINQLPFRCGWNRKWLLQSYKVTDEDEGATQGGTSCLVTTSVNAAVAVITALLSSYYWRRRRQVIHLLRHLCFKWNVDSSIIRL